MQIGVIDEMISKCKSDMEVITGWRIKNGYKSCCIEAVVTVFCR